MASYITTSPTNRHDHDRLMELAEKLQSQIDETQYRLENSDRSFDTSLLTFAIIFITAFITTLTFSESIGIIRSATILIATIFASFAYLLIDIRKKHITIRKLRTQKFRDIRALGEIVGLLREIEGVLAVSENWSPLQRAEYRIRLSRFDIPEGIPRPPLNNLGETSPPNGQTNGASE